MLKKCALIVLPALLPGCFGGSVALEPEAKSVTLVHESERPLHCKFLEKINGNSRGADEKAARAGAENDFRNQAAKLKANFALVEAERGGRVGTSSEQDFFVGGKALLCQTDEMEDAKEKAEAEAKEKKEADSEQKEQDEKSEKNEKNEKNEKSEKKGKK